MPIAFLVPALLAALAALVIPVALHLRHRERQRPIRFPSLMFLRRITIHTSERRRITDWPLLLLRAALVALAVLAFARPLLRQSVDQVAADAPRTLVIALDRSLSMGHTTTWPAALDSARRLIGTLGAGDRGALILFDEDASIAQPLTGDPAALGAALASARPVARGTRFASAFRAARQLLDAAGVRLADVYVITDLQRSGAGGMAGMMLRAGVTVHPVAVTDARSNSSLSGVSVDRMSVGTQETAVISADIVSRGLDAVRPARVVLTVNGVQRGARDVQLPRDGTQAVRFDAVAVPPGDARITVSMTPDALPADDTAHAVMPATVSHRIMLVTPSGADRDATLFLERALTIGDQPRFEIVRRSALDAAALASAGAVLFHDMVPPASPALDAWVRRGGGVVVAVGSRGLANGAVGPLLAGNPRGRVDRSADRGGLLGDVAYEHPIFEPFRTGGAAMLAEPRFLRYPRVDPADGAEVLARFDDGAPAVLERRVGDGRTLMLVVPVDSRNGDFPLQPSFLPFVRRMALHATGYVARPPALPTGSGWRPAAAVADLVVRSPSGALVRPDSGTTSGAVTMFEAGFYLAYADQATGEAVALAAANAPAAESDLSAMPAAELLVGLGQDSDTTTQLVGATASDVESRQGLWRVVLVGVALLLLVEFWMASRGWRGASGRIISAEAEGGAA